MHKPAVELLPSDSDKNLPVVIAEMPKSQRERRIASGIIIVLAIIDALTVPFVF